MRNEVIAKAVCARRCQLLPRRLPVLPGTCLLLLGEWHCLLQAASALELGSISETQKKGIFR